MLVGASRMSLHILHCGMKSYLLFFIYKQQQKKNFLEKLFWHIKEKALVIPYCLTKKVKKMHSCWVHQESVLHLLINKSA